MKYTQEFLKMAHVRSIFHYKEVAQGVFWGCFYCHQVFTREEIVDGLMRIAQKVRPPYVLNVVSTVLGDKSGLPIIDKGFLEEMHSYWF